MFFLKHCRLLEGVFRRLILISTVSSPLTVMRVFSPYLIPSHYPVALAELCVGYLVLAFWLLVPNKESLLYSSRLEFAEVSLLVKFCFFGGKKSKSPEEVLKV